MNADFQYLHFPAQSLGLFSNKLIWIYPGFKDLFFYLKKEDNV